MPPRLTLFFSFFLLCASPAPASDIALRLLPEAAVVGRGVMTYAFWDVYEATLYAPQGQWNPEQPYALSLIYYHAIDGSDIADRSVQEMRAQGFSDEVVLATWHAQMKDIFPNVKKGTVLTGIYTADEQTVFYEGVEKIGSIKDPNFGKHFFGIWLNDKTSEPKLRRALLGAL